MGEECVTYSPRNIEVKNNDPHAIPDGWIGPQFQLAPRICFTLPFATEFGHARFGNYLFSKCQQ